MIKILLKGVYRLLCHMSIDPIAAIGFLRRYPRYLMDRKKYRAMMGAELRGVWGFSDWPLLTDGDKPAASLGEYFWQDLYVAMRIIQANPSRHVDVGSRIDGFIAHLACTRCVEVIDIRPPPTDIPNVTFVQSSLLDLYNVPRGEVECVTCLHTLEHIGLGRYGDAVDHEGWRKGLTALAELVKNGGNLWLSVPIGRQRIEFNAHRIFDPFTIQLEAERSGLKLQELHYFEYDDVLRQSMSMHEDMVRLSQIDYGLGVFLFKKDRV